MFSCRTPAQLSPNPLTLAVEARRAQGAALLDLTATNPTRVGLEAPADLLTPALAAPGSALYEPHPFGARSAREALARWYADDHGLAVSPEQVVLSASTSESYTWLFKLLADPGEEILTPTPSYPLFEHLIALEGAARVSYPLAYDGRWHLDVGALEAALTPRSRAVVVVAPNNPTGTYLKRAEADTLMALCAQRGLALIVDEVFCDYPLRGDPSRVTGPFTDAPCLTFSLHGLSKLLGLPQLKLGWTVVGGPAPLREEALRRLEIVADSFLSVSTPSQLALPSLLRERARLRGPIQRRLAANLEAAREGVGACPTADLLDVEGGWSVVLRLPRVMSDEERCLALLEEHALVVHPGYFFDLPEGHLVLSLLTPEGTFREGLARLSAHLRAWE